MPVIMVTAPPLTRAADELRVLANIAAEVAAALGLTPDDVQVSCAHSATGVRGMREIEPWPLVVIYGGRREDAMVSDALARARDVVAAGWDRPADEVCVKWLAVP